MKVPLEWLADYVPTKLKPEALAERLTMAGLEVTGIEHDVLDLEITPNRADCLSIIGVAREVAAITGQRLQLPSAAARGSVKTSKAAKPIITIEDATGCPRYIGRLITGVKVGPSPDWMQRRLTAAGARPINNLVDITNYVLLEYGQPLHAFDFSRLAGGTILVRRARANEKITTLDGVARTLTPDALVIADAERAVAVAGIMGGVGSEVTGRTTTVLLESAQFDPVLVRRTARKLGLSSDSSYRFERGVDPAGVETASARAASLIAELAGGAEQAVVDVGRKPAAHAAIALDAARANRWLGIRLDPPAIRTSLARLSCRVASSGNSGSLRVIPPSFRQDLTHEVDLYEELARIAGYDKIRSTVPRIAPPAAAEGPTAYEQLRSLRTLCAELGLVETISWSLLSSSDLARCGMASGAAALANPLSQDHALLRPSLVPGLLQAVRRNLTHGADVVRIFELGDVVAERKEQARLGIAISGVWLRDWQGSRPSDFYRLSGLVQELLRRWGRTSAQFAAASGSWASAGASILVGGQRIGLAGQVQPKILQELDIEQPVWIAELSVPPLLELRRRAGGVTAPATVPPVRRDLSIVVGADVPFEQIRDTIRQIAGAKAARVELVDRYTGRQIPAGKCSLTFALEYRDAARTLTAEEADALHQQVGAALLSRFGAALR